ncbi:hypothetical protein QL285_087683 [Trifolium repens]|nr:hypothetical protein QL285_087683 [Trifolium repens]
MPNWTKNKGYTQNPQVGQWQSPPFNGKPPVAKSFSTVPPWEKKFCYSVGSVPWQNVVECKRYMYMHPNVVNWDDTAVKEAFDNAKNRFYAEIKGLPCDIPLPDPNIYIDDVDWNATVDPELYLDLEREAEACRIMEAKAEEPVILSSSLLLNQSYSGPGWGPTGWGDEEEKDETKPSEPTKTEEAMILGSSLLLNQSFSGPGWGPTGWGDEEENEATKPSVPNYATQGWESNQPENIETNSWEQQYHAPIDEHAKEYGWWQTGQNGYQGWNQREQYGDGLHNKYQGRNAGSGNWGTWDDGYNKNREYNMSWSQDPGYHHGANDYKMNRGRGRRNGGRGGGGGRRGSFGYADKVVTSGAW